VLRYFAKGCYQAFGFQDLLHLRERPSCRFEDLV